MIVAAMRLFWASVGELECDAGPDPWTVFTDLQRSIEFAGVHEIPVVVRSAGKLRAVENADSVRAFQSLGIERIKCRFKNAADDPGLEQAPPQPFVICSFYENSMRPFPEALILPEIRRVDQSVVDVCFRPMIDCIQVTYGINACEGTWTVNNRLLLFTDAIPRMIGARWRSVNGRTLAGFVQP